LDKVGVLVEFLEKVDAIVHNAGSFMLKPLQKRHKSFEDVYKVNVLLLQT
jgi:NADP-dependent 3-hydroxy acid dehydrogenase YdfG